MNYILDLYRYLKGYVEIRISGGFPERFLNLCNKEKIHLWDTLYINEGIVAKVGCKDFFSLQQIRRKTGVKITVTEKQGLYFSYRNHKNRKVLMFGLSVSLAFMIIMNQFIWTIEVTGTEKISKEDILSVTSELGLNYGTFAPAFDEASAGRETVNRFNGKLLWAAINIKGSKATVEIREYNNTVVTKEKVTEPCNVIADFNGIILSTETFSGVLNTSKGNAVKSGDILISGISENSDGSVNFHTADGKLTAYNQSSLVLSYFTENPEMHIADYTIKNKLNLFSLKIPLYVFANNKVNEQLNFSRMLNINGNTLPFGITYVIGYNTEETEQLQKSAVFFVDDFTAKEYDKYKNSLILDADYCF